MWAVEILFLLVYIFPQALSVDIYRAQGHVLCSCDVWFSCEEVTDIKYTDFSEWQIWKGNATVKWNQEWGSQIWGWWPGQTPWECRPWTRIYILKHRLHETQEGMMEERAWELDMGWGWGGGGWAEKEKELWARKGAKGSTRWLAQQP